MSKLGVRPGSGIKLDRQDLAKFGKVLVRFLIEEIKKDASKSTNIPDTKEFYDSFSYEVQGNSVALKSSWPWVEQLVEGTDGPYSMKWMTAAQGVRKIPLRDKDGSIVIRTTPLTTDKAWIHPGIARHSFFQRAMARAQNAFVDHVLEKNMDTVMGAAFGHG